MKETKNKLDTILGKAMQDLPLEKSPASFTQHVLGQITNPEAVVVKEIEPLISKRTWSIIGLVFLGAFIVSFQIGTDVEIAYLDVFAKIPNGIGSIDLSVPPIFTYSFAFLSIGTLFQLTILKRFYSKIGY